MLLLKTAGIVGKHPRVLQVDERRRGWDGVAAKLGGGTVNTGDVCSLEVGVPFPVDGDDGVERTDAGLQQFRVEPVPGVEESVVALESSVSSSQMFSLTPSVVSGNTVVPAMPAIL